MELDITLFVEKYRDCMERFSDSIARSGREDIGKITWLNALDAVSDQAEPFLQGWDTHALQERFVDYGAWSEQELADMTGQQLYALFVQFIAGDYQRYTAPDYDEEREGGSLYLANGRWYYSVDG